ncbi:MAG: hypothetical protein ACUVRV_02315 [Cyanobacteriota bacterium]
MTTATLNLTAFESLFAPWQEPNAHRVRAKKSGAPAVVNQTGQSNRDAESP